MSYEMNNLLDQMVEHNASDLHIQVGSPPTMRINGDMVSVDGPVLSAADSEALIYSIASNREVDALKSQGGADFAISFMDKVRFRVALFKSMSTYGMVLRQIPSKIKTFDEIGLPEIIEKLLHRPRGLILVTGPTGSGKTTTLASMIEWLNTHISGHIITLEDPVEYIFDQKKCMITQKELGVDILNYSSALRSCLRQDPDILFVGELRDKATIEATIEAAETGHLVLGTVHTTGAARTIDRLISVFPLEAREQIRAQLSMTLIGVISQTLIKNIEGGRVAAFEIMVQTDGIASLIREGKTFQIPNEIQTGSKHGMISLDEHMRMLYEGGLIEAEEAIKRAYYPEQFKKLLNL